MERYDTLSETMNALRREGYTEDFNLLENCLEARNGRFKEFVDQFKVDKYFRFEGSSNPSDASILYAISSNDENLKGLLVNGYGIYSDSTTDEILEKLEIRKSPSNKKHLEIAQQL